MCRRFAGPATEVSVPGLSGRLAVRTEGQAVAEAGRRLARLVLAQDQLGVLARNMPRVYLCGPPGTGKRILFNRFFKNMYTSMQHFEQKLSQRFINKNKHATLPRVK